MSQSCKCSYDIPVNGPRLPPSGRKLNLLIYTYAFVEPLAQAGQDGQGDEVTKAGSDGRGHVVWVDANPLGAGDHSHHDDPWEKTTQSSHIQATVQLHNSPTKVHELSSQELHR